MLAGCHEVSNDSSRLRDGLGDCYLQWIGLVTLVQHEGTLGDYKVTTL